MEKRYYSNGKLLITGEYLVLDGAKALALPTKFGQDLCVKNGDKAQISWKSYDADQSLWFEDHISFTEITQEAAIEKESVKGTLIDILREAYRLNPKTIDGAEGFDLSTHLSFPKQWGLGTSSTLINNIAQWFGIDAYTLLKNSFGGSGYDIACAQSDSAVLYQLKAGKPVVEKVPFFPEFANDLYFVYLNQKQNSKTAIAAYREKRGNWQSEIELVDELSLKVLHATTLEDMANELQKHEQLLSEVLQTQTIQQRLFPDFKGSIKSLGAWGGDFVLALSKEDPSAYFLSKGYPTLIKYKDMILDF